MKTKLIVLTLVVAITVVLLGFAQSSCGAQKGEQGDALSAKEMMGVIESLDLTEEQTTEIKKVDWYFQEQLLGLRNKVEVHLEEMETLFLETEPNLEEIKAKLEEITNVQAEIEMRIIEKDSAVKGILTAEQLEKLPVGILFQIIYI